VFALLAALCWLSSRLARRWTPSPAPALAPAPAPAPAPAKAIPAKAIPAKAPARVKSAPAKAAPARTKAAPAQAQPVAPPQVPGGALVKALPYLTVVIAAFAPLAAGIYLITSTAWSLAERFIWRSRVSGRRGADAAEVKQAH
jgi:YidC/Oxa1 family membrane protein insertase